MNDIVIKVEKGDDHHFDNNDNGIDSNDGVNDHYIITSEWVELFILKGNFIIWVFGLFDRRIIFFM